MNHSKIKSVWTGFAALFLPVCATAGVAQDLFDAGDLEPAAAAARARLEQDPSSLEGLLVLGRVELTLERTAAAVKTLSRAASVHADSAEAHYRLGQALSLHALHSGTWRRVMLSDDIGAAFARAVELDGGNGEYRWALFEFCRHAPSFVGGGMKCARRQAAELARIDPPRGLRAEAALLAEAGKRDAAEAKLRAAVTMAPDVADHRFALGYFYLEHERWESAFAVFEEIEQRFPEERQALFQVGRTAALSGRRLATGEQALRRYLQHKPRSGEPPLAWAHYRLGMIYEHREATAAAAAEYERAQQLDPDLDDARVALAAIRRGGS